MLDFQRGSRPRNYLSRRQQWRLLVLVMMLGLVLLLAREARKPEHFAWLWAVGRGGVEPAPARSFSNRPPRPNPSAEPLPRVEPDLLASIRDDFPFVYGERGAWFQLLDMLRKTDEATLEAASLGRVTYVQLFEQPDAYRGRLVTIRGTMRRAHRVPAPKNDLGFTQTYQAWITPADDPDNLVVVYCLDLPEDFPTGMAMEEEIALTGFFFKRWLYQAQDKLRTAPVVLAKSFRWQKRRPAAPPPPDDPQSVLKLVGSAAVFAILVTLYVFYRTRRGRSREREPSLDRQTFDEVELLPDVGRSLEQLAQDDETPGA